jgi:DNA-binding NarL/FixJ family response regulator
VVVLSQHADPLYALELFEIGPERRGYLVKDRVRNPDELNHAIREIAGGGSYVDSGVVAALIAQRSDPQLSVLTPRELEILAMIAEGRSNAAIATAAYITKRAVERHINSIFSKLGLTESDDVNRRVMAALTYLSAGRPSDAGP